MEHVVGQNYALVLRIYVLLLQNTCYVRAAKLFELSEGSYLKASFSMFDCLQININIYLLLILSFGKSEYLHCLC